MRRPSPRATPWSAGPPRSRRPPTRRRTPARPGSPTTRNTRTRCRPWSARWRRTPPRRSAPASPPRWWWRPRARRTATARNRRRRRLSKVTRIGLVRRVRLPGRREVADAPRVAPHRPDPHAHPHVAWVAAQDEVLEGDVRPVEEHGRRHIGRSDPLSRVSHVHYAERGD